MLILMLNWTSQTNVKPLQALVVVGSGCLVHLTAGLNNTGNASLPQETGKTRFSPKAGLTKTSGCSKSFVSKKFLGCWRCFSH